MRLSLILAIAFALAIMADLSNTVAHEHATGVVKERMDLMEGMAKRMKAIRERIEAKRDLGLIKADAEAIASSAPHVVHLFPPGSSQRPTEARSTIWRNWSDFERWARTLEAESKKLSETRMDDAVALGAQVRAVTQACGGCHEKYRVKR